MNHDANLNHSANASQRANLTHSVESLITLEPPEESTDIDLRDASDRVEITTDLPDCSAEDVRVIAAGRDVRIRATPSGEESTSIDRTITLSETVTDANVAVSYDDPTLTVTVRKSSQRR